MSENDIRMCVADVMRDDVIENVDSMLRMLNHPDEQSWRAARGRAFTAEEVKAAIQGLMSIGLVTPVAAAGVKDGDYRPVPKEQVGQAHCWEDLWFHLEPSGHQAVERWWETEGRTKYPS